MLRIEYSNGGTEVYLACDRCQGRLAAGDVYAWRVRENGEPEGLQPRLFHRKCFQYAQQPGEAWHSEPIKTLALDLAAGLHEDYDADIKRRERRQRSIIRAVVAAGAKGVTVRDVQRFNDVYGADEIRHHMDRLAEMGVFTYQDITPQGGGHTARRYYATDITADAAILSRVHMPDHAEPVRQ